MKNKIKKILEKTMEIFLVLASLIVAIFFVNLAMLFVAGHEIISVKKNEEKK